MELHQIDDRFVRSHNQALHWINRCPRCKPRIVTVLDHLLHFQINPRKIVALILVVMTVFILVLVFPHPALALSVPILDGLMQ